MHRSFDALVLGDAQLVAHVRGGHADAGVDAGTLRELQRIGRRVDVLVHGAGQRAHHGRVAGQLGDAAHRLEVAGTGDGKAGLDDIDVQAKKLAGDDELLLRVHGSARRLLAVAQRGIEDVDLACHAILLSSFLLPTVRA